METPVHQIPSENNRSIGSSANFQLAQWIGGKRLVKVVGILVRPDVLRQWISVDTERGRFKIEIVPMDDYTSLYDESGYPRFNRIIHDGRSTVHKKLTELNLQRPGIVNDHPDDIIQLFKRNTMLLPVARLGIDQVGIPNQMFVCHEQDFVNIKTAVLQENLKFPLIMKTMEAGGSLESHQMLFASTMEHLENLYLTGAIKLPFVVQEFVDHGGILYKVYVAGSQVECTKRKSFPDFHLWGELGIKMDVPHRISFDPAQEWNDPQLMTMEQLPGAFVHKLAVGLRKELKLNLFNFDMIKKTVAGGGNEYLIVDINYFPGYHKIPKYERFLTSFLNEVVQRK